MLESIICLHGVKKDPSVLLSSKDLRTGHKNTEPEELLLVTIPGHKNASRRPVSCRRARSARGAQRTAPMHKSHNEDQDENEDLDTNKMWFE